MDDIQQATQYFLKAQKPLMRDTYISDILQGFDAINDNRKLLEKLFFEKVTNLRSSHVDAEENSTQNPRGSHENIEDGQEQSVNESSNCISRRFHQDAEIIQVEEEHAAQNSILDPREISVEAETNKNELEQQQAETSSSRKSREETQQNPSRSSHQDYSDVWDRFLKKLREINGNKETNIIHLSDLQTWVERAHSECMNLANTLSNAKEVASCLNHILSWLLTGAVFLMWLLFTRLANTKVLVLIASPLLAATFIFGDTCKRLFEPIFFVLVVHHINVGDLCFIDEKMAEVRSIGIWRTTFTKVDNFSTTPRVLIYSTSELTNKAIINHKKTFDWSDRAEFKLSNLKKISSELKHELTNFVKGRLTEEKCSFLSKILNLTLSAMEDSITLIIHLQYKADNTEGWTYSECFRQKHELKGDFHVYMQHVISEFKAEQTKMPATEQARNEVSHLEIEESSLRTRGLKKALIKSITL